MKERIYGIIRYVLALVMLCFALLQMNDPDPFVWMCSYSLVAIVSVLGTASQNRWRIVLGMMYVLLALWMFPEEYHGVGEMNEYRPEIEQARESLGILMAGGICFLSSWLYSNASSNSDEN